MATLDADTVYTLAREQVLEYLAAEIEYIDIVEFVSDAEPDADEDDINAVADKAREILNDVYEKAMEETNE